MLKFLCTSELDWSFYIKFIAETSFKKIGNLIGFMRFISAEVVLS